MKTGIIKRLSFAAVVAGLGIAMAAPAQAAFKLRLSSGGTMATVEDQMAGDANPVAGAITFIGALGATTWTVNVTTGLSKPVLGASNTAHMDLNSVNVSSAGAGSLTIELTDTDFTTSSPSSFKMQIGGTLQNTLSYSAYLDTANGEFAQSTLIGTLGPFGPGGAFAGSTTGGGPFFQVLPYSLTQVVSINHSAGSSQSTSFDAELRAVPEPGSLALFGMSIFGFGLALRRRLRLGQAA